jgi:uncharacterized membrane protein (UPF0127 family)
MKSNIKFILIILLFFLCIFLVFNKNNINNIVNNKQEATRQVEKNINLVKINDVFLNVEVVSTNESRAKGLSGRESLREDSGMLFIFNNTGNYLFWMKDMNFPIDIIWIDENYKIVLIEKNIKPDSYPALYGGGSQAKYVLETISGFSDTNNVKIGDTVYFFSSN